MKPGLAIACLLFCDAASASEIHLRAHIMHTHLSVTDSNQTVATRFMLHANMKKAKDLFGYSTLTIVIVMNVLLCLMLCIFAPWMNSREQAVYQKAGEESAKKVASALAQRLRVFFDETCPEEEKAKYCSEGFKAKCDQMFKAADRDSNGKLDPKELEAVVAEYDKQFPAHQRILREIVHKHGLGGGQTQISQFQALIRAFDVNCSSTIEPDEFLELMKCLEYRKDRRSRAIMKRSLELKVGQVLRKQFNDECPTDQKDQYCLQEFKDRCSEMFKSADKDSNGKLDMRELEAVVAEWDESALKDLYIADADVTISVLSALVMAFDCNQDSTIDSDEFYELMKYLAFRKSQAERREQKEASHQEQRAVVA